MLHRLACELLPGSADPRAHAILSFARKSFLAINDHNLESQPQLFSGGPVRSHRANCRLMPGEANPYRVTPDPTPARITYPTPPAMRIFAGFLMRETQGRLKADARLGDWGLKA